MFTEYFRHIVLLETRQEEGKNSLVVYTYPYIVILFSYWKKLIIYVEHMSVKLWNMSFKTVKQNCWRGRKKTRKGKKKKTQPTQAKSSFRRATTENNLKMYNLIIKLQDPIQYLKEPKMSCYYSLYSVTKCLLLKNNKIKRYQ